MKGEKWEEVGRDTDPSDWTYLTETEDLRPIQTRSPVPRRRPSVSHTPLILTT